VRRFVPVLLVVALVVSMAMPVAAQDDISVIIDGQQQSFDPAPTIVNGRTLVPMRAFFEALGADVEWEDETRTAIGKRGDIEVRIPIDSMNPTVNGVTNPIDVAARIIESRTFIPARFVSEALGDDVGWDPETRTVIVTSKGETVPTPGSDPEREDLVVHFIDVGQGDSILVEGPTGKVMLVDAGTRSAGEKVVSYLKQAGISSIDIFVATHAHEDHIGGFAAVADAFSIGEVYDTGYSHTTQTYERMLTIIDEKDIGFNLAHVGNRINLDSNLDIPILHPGELLDDVNNNSIVLKLTHGQVSFILTGDAEAEAEQLILNRGKSTLNSDILKVGHHGSRTSTSDAFLTAVSPEIAVIMCGEGNSYGHPHRETLDKLTRTGVEIYRTDIAGDIVVTSDGVSYEVTGSPYDHTTAPAPEPDPEPQPEPGATTGAYVGSTQSDKYHNPNCRYAESIAPENEIWFADKAEAEAAGYIPCGVCNP
jgi:beta-lactamase superfamily II metal-dependent hydrolase